MSRKTAKKKSSSDQNVDRALRRKLLSKPDPEDPKRCELHHFILSKAKRFEYPEQAGGWQRHAARLRRRFFTEIYFRGHSGNLLNKKPAVGWRGVIDMGCGYRARKLRYEGFPGMWIPGLLYEPVELKGRLHRFLNERFGLDTPAILMCPGKMSCSAHCN